MRRLLFVLVAACATCALAACGNKGPLVRPASTPAAAATAASPAPATSVTDGAHSG